MLNTACLGIVTEDILLIYLLKCSCGPRFRCRCKLPTQLIHFQSEYFSHQPQYFAQKFLQKWDVYSFWRPPLTQIPPYKKLCKIRPFHILRIRNTTPKTVCSLKENYWYRWQCTYQLLLSFLVVIFVNKDGQTGVFATKWLTKNDIVEFRAQSITFNWCEWFVRSEIFETRQSSCHFHDFLSGFCKKNEGW